MNQAKNIKAMLESHKKNNGQTGEKFNNSFEFYS